MSEDLGTNTGGEGEGGGEREGFLGPENPGAGGEGSGAGDGGGAGEAAAGAAGGQDAAKDTEWMKSLPDELRNERILSDFGSAEDAHRGYIALFKKMGGGPNSLLRMPAADAGAEAWNTEIFNRLGRPEAADGYKLPQGMEVADDQYMTDLRAGMHSAGITANQFASLMGTIEKAEVAQADRMKKSGAGKLAETQSATRLSLQKEWGDDYKEMDHLVGRVIYGLPEETQKALVASGLAADPAILKVFAELGQGRRDDSPGMHIGSMGASDAMGEIKRLALDPEFQKALNDSGHPGHHDAIKRHSDLYESAYGSEPAFQASNL